MDPLHRPNAALTKHYWLDAPHGRVMIGAWSIVIGRSLDCSIVLEQPEISRHHVLVRLGRDRAELLPLGREPVRLSGIGCAELTPLRPDDRIEAGTWAFTVGEAEIEDAVRGAAPRGSRAATNWTRASA